MFSTHVVVFLELEKMVIYSDVEIVFTFIDVPIPSGRKRIRDFNAK